MKKVTDTCLCGETSATYERHHGLGMLRCRCGVLRQMVNLTEAQLADWYRERYLSGVYYHSYEHDRVVAERRLDAYKLRRDVTILDVGAGNGAFVDAAVTRGYDAVGQDLAEQSDGPRVYVGALRDVAFPTGFVDTVTMHDVLEHVPDPRSFLNEVCRILRPGGTLIVDFPRFHCEEGKHHWKEVEHLWMLDDEQLVELIKSCSFTVYRVDHPISSKTVVYATSSEAVSRVKILVPPGIGDGYWVLAKLRGFLAMKDVTLPTVYVHDSGPRRAADMWARVPFVRLGGYAAIHKSGAWDRAYKTPGHAVQRKVQGFTYFISMNAALDHGFTLDDALPGPTNWHERMFVSKDELSHMATYRDRYGPYVLCAFWDKGFYQSWVRDFSEQQIINTLRLIATRYTVVLMGASWDTGGLCERVARRDPRFVNLVGGTSFAEMMGLIRGANAVFGFPAGNTILAPHLDVPTLLMWNGHFPQSMWHASVAPDAPYVPVSTHDAKAAYVAGRVMEMAER